MAFYWRTAALVLLALQLAGCSAAGGQQSADRGGGGFAAAETGHEPAASAPAADMASALPPNAAAGNGNAASPEGKAASTPESTESAEPVETPSAPERRELYRMNEAYRFVPLEANAPEDAVLLTFDDGPKDREVLTRMLDTLDQHGAQAIFFVNGYRVKQNPDLLLAIHERGQTIGNHAYDHINLRQEDRESVERQIGDVQAEVERLTGERPRFFRPPYGAGNDIVKEIAKNHGMLYMTWSNGSLDWDSSAKDKPEVVIRNVLDQLHAGANILMHELPWTADALDELLSELASRGYSFIDPDTIRLDGD